MLYFRAHGLGFACNGPIKQWLTHDEGEVDITIQWESTPPFLWEDITQHPLFCSSFVFPGGEPIFRVYRVRQVYIIAIPRIVNFFVFPDRIICQTLEQPDLDLIENYLIGLIMAFCLEQQGIFALHASAVITPNGPVAFLADSYSGKSSLVAYAVQSGQPLVTDDLLAVRKENGQWLAYPGVPSIRLYPNVASRVLTDLTEYERVHPLSEKLRIPVGTGRFGRFCTEPLPLTGLYLISRDTSGAIDSIDIAPLQRSDALIALVSNSYLARLLTALGMQAQRMPGLAQLAMSMPVKRLIYPSGYDHLPTVIQAVLADACGE